MKLLDTKNGESRTVPLTQAATQAFKEALENPIRPIDTNLIFFGEPGKDEKRRPYVFSKVWNGMKNGSAWQISGSMTLGTNSPNIANVSQNTAITL